MSFYQEFSSMISKNIKRMSSSYAINSVINEEWERVDIFSVYWDDGLFETYCSNYYDIDLFLRKNPNIEIIQGIVGPDHYIVIGGFYGWSKTTNKCELLEISVLNIENGKLTNYANPVLSSQETA